MGKERKPQEIGFFDPDTYPPSYLRVGGVLTSIAGLELLVPAIFETDASLSAREIYGLTGLLLIALARFSFRKANDNAEVLKARKK